MFRLARSKNLSVIDNNQPQKSIVSAASNGRVADPKNGKMDDG